MARTLFVASSGGAALLALQARHVGLLPGGEPRRDGPPQPGGRVRRRVTAALLLLHLPVAAASLTALVATQSAFGSFFTGGHRTVPDVPDLEEQSLIFVTGQEFPVAYTPICRWVEGRHAPERTALLSPFWSESRVTREDLWTLVIEPAAGFLAVDADRIERHPSAGFAVGEVVGMPDFDAEVRAVTDDGRPREVAFRFLEPLEAPRYRWMRWGPGGAEPFALPAVGETVVLPAQDVTSLIDRW
jgi:hypothetical protein